MADFRTQIVNVRDKTTGQSLVISDGMENVLTGIGGSMDPMASAFYRPNYLDQNQIESAFRTSALTRKVITVPPTDAVRAWRTFQAEDADITAIEAEERRLGLQSKIRRAEILSRMYGGSAIIIGTSDGKLTEPLDVKTIKKGALQYLHVVSKNRITYTNLILDPGSPFFGKPPMYQVSGGMGQLIDIHPSRMVKFVNDDLPDEILEMNSGWGDSILMTLWSSLTNSDTAQSTFAALLSKSVVDTVYFANLTSMVATQEGENQLKRRVMIAKAFESILGVKMMDAGAGGDGPAEKWETRALSWAGIPDVMDAFTKAVAAAADIPYTRLGGVSPGGLNATGAHDESNYFQAISAGQELSLRPRLNMIDEVLVRSAIGEYPNNLWFFFNPLAVDSDAVKADNALKRSNAIKNLKESETVPIEVMQEIVKNQIIGSGEFPGAEQAFDDYIAGNLEPLIEEPEAEPIDPLIPVDPTTGLATQNRESRLFGQRQAAANDHAARLMSDGASALDAFTEAMRLTDATPRPLYVSRAVLNADDIQAWMTEQGLGELQPGPHVTILYSREPVDWLKMGSSWSDRDNDGSGRLTITAGGPRVVEPLGDRTAVLMFSSTDLQWRHREMVEAGASHDYPDYTPHISLTASAVDLTKVRPYSGKIELGPEVFQQIEA